MTIRAATAGDESLLDWESVVAARGVPERRKLLYARIFEVYWRPLHVFVMRRGVGWHEAEDLTQGFFVQLIQKDVIFRHCRTDRGKLSTYLFTCFHHYLVSQHRRNQALKRGGGLPQLRQSIASENGEIPDRQARSPGETLDQTWAAGMVRWALSRVRLHYEEKGQRRLFDCLWPHLVDAERPLPSTEACRAIGKSSGAMRVALVRMRRLFGQSLRAGLENRASASTGGDDFALLRQGLLDGVVHSLPPVH